MWSLFHSPHNNHLTLHWFSLTRMVIFFIPLGSFDLRVDVTQGGDVLFEVTLPTPLSKPINLIMEYVNLDNPLRRKNVTTNVAYIAKTSFLHLEPSSRVPFDRFRVSVRLISSFIIGPPVEDDIDRG